MTPSGKFPELQSRFGALSQDLSEFLHPQGRDILSEAEKTLGQCPTGQHLLTVAQEYGVQRFVSVTPNLQGYHPQGRRIYVCCPVGTQSAGPPQIIDLTGFLRLAEHDIIGMGTLPVGSDIEEREGREHARRLDQIVEMCRLTIELEATETELFNALHQEILARGYGSIYTVLIREHIAEDLLAAYDLLIKK